MRALYLIVLAVALSIAVTACGTAPATNLKPAERWMMVPPQPLGDLPEGFDYKDEYTKLRFTVAGEKHQLRALQRRERTLTGK